jgi:DNA polymerase elongation subunit (family B)
MNKIYEQVEKFLMGRNPMERVVAIECDYDDDRVSIIYNTENGDKKIHLDDFKPFCWVKRSACLKMFDGDRQKLRNTMNYYGIAVKPLTVSMQPNQNVNERLKNGYEFMFYAKKRMSFSEFQKFFQTAKTPIYPRKKKNESSSNVDKEILCVAPVEQYMIASGIRLFKGYNGYDELKRMLFDLETTGLVFKKDHIDQIGIRTNKGFETVINVKGDTLEERIENEHKATDEFLQIIAREKPDIIAGHNSENFDWRMLIENADAYGESFADMSLKYLRHPIYKKNKESVLKLGGEVEYFKPTCMWGTTILDSMHAVRRAQATDSNIKNANLKYVTKYLNLQKENRVYVPGDKIGKIWRDTEEKYAFNDKDGDWYEINEKHPIKEGYERVSGEYVVKRYLLDDIWETDKVELTLNESNFLIAKMLPTTFNRAATMGTAGIWKLILLAWCYENNLAVPSFTKSHSFVGGLSRLLKTGYAANVAKLDYNSLYPSIMLTWWVKSEVDVTNAILNMLNYVLTQREHYKGLKNEAGKQANKLSDYLKENSKHLTEEEIKKIKGDIQHFKAEKNANDKKQNPLKVLGNSVFGSFGSPSLFPFGDQKAAEFVTCTGRQCLRIMISHFKNLGYEPIVGDSVLGDTPLFIKYNDSNMIDIKPICEIFNDKFAERDALNREYDYSKKDYKVLCRSGWSDVNYVYRHKTDKDIYTVKDGNMSVDVTQDHSLFDEKQQEIKPTEITQKTKLEYFNGDIYHTEITSDKAKLTIQKCETSDRIINVTARYIKRGLFERFDTPIMNMSKDRTKQLLDLIGDDFVPSNKTLLAQLIYLKNKVSE